MKWLSQVWGALEARGIVRWVARVSLIWTAWGVLASLKSVQDVLDWLQRTAADFNERVAWAIDLIVWALNGIAATFHWVADLLFGWLPFLSWIPDAYKEPIIVASLAIIPSAISLIRSKRLAQSSAGITTAFATWMTNPERFAILEKTLAYGGPDITDADVFWAVSHALTRCKQHGETSDGGELVAFEHVVASWSQGKSLALKHATTLVSLLGFTVFSARVYASLLLCVALTWELAYTQSADGGVEMAVMLVWLSVIIAIAIGYIVRLDVSGLEREKLPELTVALAKLWSVPVSVKAAKSLYSSVESSRTGMLAVRDEPRAIGELIHRQRFTGKMEALDRPITGKDLEKAWSKLPRNTRARALLLAREEYRSNLLSESQQEFEFSMFADDSIVRSPSLGALAVLARQRDLAKATKRTVG